MQLSAEQGDSDRAWCDLIANARDGDRRSVSLLYRRLRPRVMAEAMRMCRNEACAEEVLQDTLAQVCRTATRYDAARGRPVTWVLMIMRTRALDTLRRRSADVLWSRLRARPGPDDSDSEDALLDPAAEATEPVDHRLSRRLRDLVGALEPTRRQLISMCYDREMTHDEAARQLELPIGTVKSHLRRSLLQMRKALAAP